MDKLALTIDLEYPKYGLQGPKDSSPEEFRPKGGERLLEILERKGENITFFVLANLCDTHPEHLTDIKDHGHEIASHTLNHRLLTGLDAEGLHEEIHSSKEKIEETLDIDVEGFRSPLLKQNEEVFREIESAGYRYDSSMTGSLPIPFWFGNDDIESARPFRKGDIVEVPVSVNPYLKIPISGFMARFFGEKYLTWSIEALQARGITPVIYFHSYALHRENKKNWRQNFRAGRYTLEMIETLADRYELVKMEELADI